MSISAVLTCTSCGAVREEDVQFDSVAGKLVDVTPCQAILSDDPVEWCGGGMTGRAKSDGRDLGMVLCSSEQTPISKGWVEDPFAKLDAAGSDPNEAAQVRKDTVSSFAAMSLPIEDVPLAASAFAAGRAAGLVAAENMNAELRRALAEATVQCVEHDEEYDHHTPATMLANWRALVARELVETPRLIVERRRPQEPAQKLNSGKFIQRQAKYCVEAVRWTGDNFAEVEAWLLRTSEEFPGAPRAEDVKLNSEARIVSALDEDGWVHCGAGGWFVERLNGEIVALTDEEFGKKYVADPRVGSITREPKFSFPTFGSWRAWALDLLHDSNALSDEDLRRKISAVVEAPSVIETDVVHVADPGKVTDEVFIADSSAYTSAVDVVVEACARVGHEVYRQAIAPSDMLPWDQAPESEKAVARETAAGTLAGTTPEQWHAKWWAEKLADGWKPSDYKDEERKTHPNLVPYDQLPPEQRAIDQLFVAAVESTRRAIDELETAYAVPTFKVPSPEQFEKFKRDWERQVSNNPDAWKMPIVSTFDAKYQRLGPISPYTRSGLVEFLDRQVDSMLDIRHAWGSLREVESLILAQLETRAFVIAGTAGKKSVMGAYVDFVHAEVSGLVGDLVTVESMSTQFEKHGVPEKFVPAMREFVDAQRYAYHPPRDKVVTKGQPAVERKRLVALFEKHCECRPTNTARVGHSHDCDTGITDDVRTVIHRVVEFGPDEMEKDVIRAATDDEVRLARRRLVVDAVFKDAVFKAKKP